MCCRSDGEMCWGNVLSVLCSQITEKEYSLSSPSLEPSLASASRTGKIRWREDVSLSEASSSDTVRIIEFSDVPSLSESSDNSSTSSSSESSDDMTTGRL